jgi:hypothetical protein
MTPAGPRPAGPCGRGILRVDSLTCSVFTGERPASGQEHRFTPHPRAAGPESKCPCRAVDVGKGEGPLLRPRLTIEQLLAWADAHFARTGEWPSSGSGPVPDAPGENWRAINQALRVGARGLPVGSSLARLLGERRGRRAKPRQPPLTVEQILRWADLHHRRTGRWPSAEAGPVADVGEETWSGINTALKQGFRGLPGEDSLAKLLDRERRGRGTGGEKVSRSGSGASGTRGGCPG